MASRSRRLTTPSGWASTLLVVAAAAAAALALYFGTGLHPHPWLTWWVPLPLLLLAAMVPTRLLVVGAAAAGAAGGSNLWSYATATLSLPVPVALGYVLGEGVLLGLVVLVFDRLVRRGHLLGAAVCAPAVWVVGEWLASTLSPNGAFLSVAYSQVGWRPLLAIVSLTGVWGLSYLVLALPAALAVLVRGRGVRRTVLKVGVWLVAVVTVVGGYGAWYDASSAGQTGRIIDVGLVALRQPYDPVDVTSPRGRQLLAAYESQASRLTISGAALIVTPEKVFTVSAAAEGGFVRTLRAFARSRNVDLVVGFVLADSSSAGTLSNVAMAFPASGGPPATYLKQHLIPSYESAFTAGDRSVVVPSGAGLVGPAICKDMDFPALSRAYAQAGAGLMAVPAWDFTSDGWLHSRIAVTAGVASGMSVVRSARDGALTVSDADGHVVAESRTGASPFASVRASVSFGSHHTLYDAWGDWFAWLCVLLAAAGLVGGRAPRQEMPRPRTAESADTAARVFAEPAG